jgi:hypothetical protein
MKNLTSPLKVFAYTRRENGLMVVGTREAMQELAAKLQAGTMQAAAPSTKEWPAEIAATSLQLGPYRGSQNWHLSFHIEGTVPAEKVVPLRRNGPPGALVVCILALALISCVSVVRWALSVL